MSKRLFSHLERLESGDRIYVTVMEQQLCYLVKDTLVVAVEELYDFCEYFLPRQDEELLTLVSCDSLQEKTHRFLAVAEKEV